MAGKACRISRITSYSLDIRSPLVEGVGILRICRFCRSSSVIGRRSAICYILIGFKDSSIFVLPGNGISSESLFISCLIGSVFRDIGDLWRPAGECVSVLRIRSLGRIIRFNDIRSLRTIVVLGCCLYY